MNLSEQLYFVRLFVFTLPYVNRIRSCWFSGYYKLNMNNILILTCTSGIFPTIKIY